MYVCVFECEHCACSLNDVCICKCCAMKTHAHKGSYIHHSQTCTYLMHTHLQRYMNNESCVKAFVCMRLNEFHVHVQGLIQEKGAGRNLLPYKKPPKPKNYLLHLNQHLLKHGNILPPTNFQDQSLCMTTK